MERKQVNELWGEKCPDYDPECRVCRAWRMWETDPNDSTLQQDADEINSWINEPEDAEDDVELWYVQGDPTTTFATKIEAEAYARRLFPEESEDKRYSRIFFRR